MSIPLLWFLFGWLGLIAIFAFMAFLTVAMTLRFGVSCTATYVYTGLFSLVTGSVLLAMTWYIFTVDWTQSVVLFGRSTLGL